MQKFHSKMTPRSLYTQFPLTEITYAKVCSMTHSYSLFSELHAILTELTVKRFHQVAVRHVVPVIPITSLMGHEQRLSDPCTLYLILIGQKVNQRFLGTHIEVGSVTFRVIDIG